MKSLVGMSFLNEYLIEDFMFKLVDLDANGEISIKDLALFLSNLPNELELVIDTASMHEAKIINNKKLLRIMLRKKVKIDSMMLSSKITNNIPLHQLEPIAEIFMRLYNKEENVMERASFRFWLSCNTDLMEYIFNIICPLSWISLETIYKHYSKRSEVEFTALQKSFLSFYVNSDNHLDHGIEEFDRQGFDFNRMGCWLCCNREFKVSSESFFFERNYVKKGNLLLRLENGKKKRYFLTLNSNSLYVLQSDLKFAEKHGILDLKL